MSHFYGMIPVSARKTTATARGHKNTGLTTIAASYAGAIKVEIWHDAREGRDRYSVRLIDWESEKTRCVIAEGWLDEAAPDVVHELKREAARAA